VLFGLTLLTIALMPAWRLTAVSDRLSSQPGRSLLVGLAWLVLGHFLFVVVVAVLAMTIIGIPLALMLGLAYIVLGLVALGIVAAGSRPALRGATGCSRSAASRRPFRSSRRRSSARSSRRSVAAGFGKMLELLPWSCSADLLPGRRHPRRRRRAPARLLPERGGISLPGA
jgi:hypothetical protein